MTESCYCDFEPWAFYSAKILTAKKLHCCSECESGIHPGEKYERTAGVFGQNIS